MTVSRRRFLRGVAGAGMLPSFLPSLATSQERSALSLPDLSELRERSTDELVLALVGDIFLMRQLPDRVDGEAERVFDVLREADVAFANLENGLSTTGSAEAGGFQRTDWGGGRTGPSLRGHPSLAAELKWMGVGAVSLANNHTGNYGRESLLETCTTLDGIGVRHAGAGKDLEEAFAPTYLEVRGLTIAFLSLYNFYYRYGAEDLATDTEPGIAFARAYDVLLQVPAGLESTYLNPKRDNPPYQLGLQAHRSQSVLAPLKEDVERMVAAISGARARADLVILSVHFHWGRSGNHDVPFQQRVLVQAALEAGVDLLVGHGPHALAGVERYADKAVAYSLGNFALLRGEPRPDFPLDAVPRSRESVVLRATVTRKKIVTLEILPIVIAADGRPRFVTGDVGRRILHKLSGLSAPFGTAVEPTGWFGTVQA